MNSMTILGAEVRPRLIRRRVGGWLAVAPEGCAIRLGVTAETEEGAREKFSRSLIEVAEALAAERREEPCN